MQINTFLFQLWRASQHSRLIFGPKYLSGRYFKIKASKTRSMNQKGLSLIFGPSPSSDCMANDQNNSWKNLLGVLYNTFNKRKPYRQPNGGFINDINSSFENLNQEKIQNAIDLQPKVLEAIIKANGGHTNYMSCGSMS